ncbi:hypothetical protein HDV00_009582 [Rhizophlyctis rosea]|nr:hypothetical protein HDV00_009582 [Rhizophlyctis rosea]
MNPNGPTYSTQSSGPTQGYPQSQDWSNPQPDHQRQQQPYAQPGNPYPSYTQTAQRQPPFPPYNTNTFPRPAPPSDFPSPYGYSPSFSYDANVLASEGVGYAVNQFVTTTGGGVGNNTLMHSTTTPANKFGPTGGGGAAMLQGMTLPAYHSFMQQQGQLGTSQHGVSSNAMQSRGPDVSITGGYWQPDMKQTPPTFYRITPPSYQPTNKAPYPEGDQAVPYGMRSTNYGTASFTSGGAGMGMGLGGPPQMLYGAQSAMGSYSAGAPDTRTYPNTTPAQSYPNSSSNTEPLLRSFSSDYTKPQPRPPPTNLPSFPHESIPANYPASASVGSSYPMPSHRPAPALSRYHPTLFPMGSGAEYGGVQGSVGRGGVRGEGVYDVAQKVDGLSIGQGGGGIKSASLTDILHDPNPDTAFDPIAWLNQTAPHIANANASHFMVPPYFPGSAHAATPSPAMRHSELHAVDAVAPGSEVASVEPEDMEASPVMDGEFSGDGGWRGSPDAGHGVGVKVEGMAGSSSWGGGRVGGGGGRNSMVSTVSALDSPHVGDSHTGREAVAGTVAAATTGVSGGARRKKTMEETDAECAKCYKAVGHVLMHGTRAQFETAYMVDVVCLACDGGNIASAGAKSPTEETVSGGGGGKKKKRAHKDHRSSAVHCEICKSVIASGGVRTPKSGERESTYLSLASTAPTNHTDWTDPEFGVEFICVSCHAKYAFCTECGGGGKYRTGKWRPVQLFPPARKTCSLPHVRIGRGPFARTVWRVPDEIQDVATRGGKEALDGLMEDIHQMYTDMKLIILATPRYMERVAEVSTWEKLKGREGLWGHLVEHVFGGGGGGRTLGVGRGVRRYLAVELVLDGDGSGKKGGGGDVREGDMPNGQIPYRDFPLNREERKMVAFHTGEWNIRNRTLMWGYSSSNDVNPTSVGMETFRLIMERVKSESLAGGVEEWECCGGEGWGRWGGGGV